MDRDRLHARADHEHAGLPRLIRLAAALLGYQTKTPPLTGVGTTTGSGTAATNDGSWTTTARPSAMIGRAGNDAACSTTMAMA